MRHHAFVIEAGAEEGIECARAFGTRELGLDAKGNPDVVVLQYGLLSVEDARRVGEVAAQAPLAGDTKLIIIAAARAYHEAQNALLKVFEEPPAGTYLVLVLPSLGMLLPTLRSRVQSLSVTGTRNTSIYGSNPIVEEFLKATREKRGAIAKRLATGRDEDERRANRDEALAIVDGIEAAAYHDGHSMSINAGLLRELAVLRGFLHDRSAPVRMILEHLALVTPKNLV